MYNHGSGRPRVLNASKTRTRPGTRTRNRPAPRDGACRAASDARRPPTAPSPETSRKRTARIRRSRWAPPPRFPACNAGRIREWRVRRARRAPRSARRRSGGNRGTCFLSPTLVPPDFHRTDRCFLHEERVDMPYIYTLTRRSRPPSVTRYPASRVRGSECRGKSGDKVAPRALPEHCTQELTSSEYHRCGSADQVDPMAHPAAPAASSSPLRRPRIAAC